jgi:hypothetical protein
VIVKLLANFSCNPTAHLALRASKDNAQSSARCPILKFFLQTKAGKFPAIRMLTATAKIEENEQWNVIV